MAVTTIADELKAHRERAQQIIAKAKREDRDVTPEEARELDTLTAAIDKLAAKRATNAGLDALLAKVNGRAADVGLDPRAHLLAGRSANIGAQITQHPAFEEFLARRGGGRPIEGTPFEIEAAGPYVPPAGGFPPMTQVPPTGSPMAPWGPAMARDLFTSLPASGGNVPYLQDQPPTSGAADIVAPGAAKPELTLQPTLKSDPLVKIADWAGVANEVLEDVDGFSAWCNSILALAVIDREDVYLGATLTAIVGRTADRAKAAGETVADAILAQAVLVQTASKLPVDGVILATDSFAKLVTEKATGGGGYLVGAPLAAPATSLWGQLRLAVSANLPTGTAMVGAYRRGGAIYRKGTLRIDLSESHADYFTKNLTAIRAEQRELLAVFKPLAFGAVTGLLV